ncbi:hypothetical protein A2U01_0087326, partial [Trifolium medium]|nr:hypothetical protein [Trifolium medium]
GGRGREGKYRVGVQGDGGGNCTSFRETEFVGLFSRVDPIRFARCGERDG